jgi:LysM repeat protein
MKSRTVIPRIGIPLAAIIILCFLLVPGVSADSTYVVQRGDTLFRIAINHGLTLGELARANHIVNPDVIYAGQVLVIPDGESEIDDSLPEDVATGEEVSSGTYVIQKGDTLFRIALRFGVSTQALAQANGIVNPSYIYAGQTLIIPGSDGGASTGNTTSPIAPISYGPRWIDVNLTTQRLIAYEEKEPVYSTAISSGLWPHLTVTGLFEVYVRYQSQTMNGYRLGYDYYLTNVPYVMYFYRDYAIHGTYWHNNFGTPMSHGCVNAPTPDAQWLYNWSSYGTPVNVHY